MVFSRRRRRVFPMRHRLNSSTTERSIDRAVPASMRTAPSTSLAFMSFIFTAAISRTVRLRPDRRVAPLPAVAVPFSIFASFLHQEVAVRRRLGDEGEVSESPIRRDHHRHRYPRFHIGGYCVEFLHESHDVQAMLAEHNGPDSGATGWPSPAGICSSDVATTIFFAIIPRPLAARDRGACDPAPDPPHLRAAARAVLRRSPRVPPEEPGYSEGALRCPGGYRN